MLLALVIAPLRPLAAQWSVEAFLGSSWSARAPLTVRQEGLPEYRITAEYSTRPFEEAPYYGVRIARWLGRWGVALDEVHHKIYLDNTDRVIRKFRITYGYNLVGLGPMYRVGEWSVLGLVGPVLTNPSTNIRGTVVDHKGGILDTGYHVDGLHLSLGVNRRFHVAGLLFVTADARVSRGWVTVDIGNGSADAPNLAGHLLLGLGLGNRRRP